MRTISAIDQITMMEDIAAASGTIDYASIREEMSLAFDQLYSCDKEYESLTKKQLVDFLDYLFEPDYD
jgi:hypothetical protein